MDDTEKVRRALFMFIDLFGLDRFDYETLARFFITVKRNYRQVAYHNWTHGFHVANSIYSILKSSPGIFKPLEARKNIASSYYLTGNISVCHFQCLAMFVGAICHDLDHRGFNNKFMIDVGSPLAAIYSTSTMEHHHFNMTVTILQQENHNIFSRLNPEEYRQVLGNIKHCILATDLALFFPNKARCGKLHILWHPNSTMEKGTYFPQAWKHTQGQGVLLGSAGPQVSVIAILADVIFFKKKI